MPCVACNRQVKFGSLLARARAWDATAVATGHYARITRDDGSGRMLLWRGRDARKDQSDFLWPLTQAQLAAARFPVGELVKDAGTGEGARRSGSPPRTRPRARRSASSRTTTIVASCGGGAPEAFRAGPIVDGEGRELGRHAGLADFTVGQRRGLGLATGRSLYVTALDPARNAVVVGGADELEADRLWADQVNLISVAGLDEPLAVQAKIRHSQAPVGDGPVSAQRRAPTGVSAPRSASPHPSGRSRPASPSSSIRATSWWAVG